MYLFLLYFWSINIIYIIYIYIFLRKRNDVKVNNRMKELTVDLLSDEQESKKYQDAFNMNFHKTKEKGNINSIE